MPIPGRSDARQGTGEALEPVVVVGPGAVGGLLAALMWRAGIDVTCVASPRSADILASEGLRLKSAAFGDFFARPRVVERLTDERPGVVFVATKAPQLDTAMKALDPCLLEQAIIVPLLNGFEHLARLRRRFGPRVAAGTIGRVEVYRRSPSHVVHTTPGARIEVASDGDVGRSRLNAVTALLNHAGMDAVVLDSEAAVMWGKLVRLSAIACATAASGMPVGRVRINLHWRRLLEGAVQEAAQVAAAEGLRVDPSEVMRQIDSLPDALETSLQRDVLAGRTGELDAVAGAIVRAGARHGIDCPTINGLVEQVTARAARAAGPRRRQAV